MSTSPLAGKLAQKEMLVDVAQLEQEYYKRRPDMQDPSQLVSFGTSGHRGSPLNGTFTEAHILAITLAICDYRQSRGTDGPLYMGKDTHAVSVPAQRTALEVLAANNGEVIILQNDGVTPTPEQKAKLQKLSPANVKEPKLAGELITAKLTVAPGNGAPIDGLKVVAASGWFAARPSGTENIYKIYAESFKDQGHVDAIVSEAQEIVTHALESFDSAHQREAG